MPTFATNSTRQSTTAGQSRGVAAGVAAVLIACLAIATSVHFCAAADPAAKPQKESAPAVAKRPYTTETVHGKVVWLEDGLSQQFGVATEPSAAETAVVLETAGGQLLPIIPDTRGRAFAVDPQLRGIDLELLVRRYRGVPMIQVIRVFRTKDRQRYELDYWCDICSIPMFILKDCECCQGPTRLRERPVDAEVGKTP